MARDDRERPREPEGAGPVAEGARGGRGRRRRRGRSSGCAGRGRAARRRCPPRARGARRRRRAGGRRRRRTPPTTRATRTMIASMSRWRAMPPATPAMCRSVTLRRRRPRSFISSRLTRGPVGGCAGRRRCGLLVWRWGWRCPWLNSRRRRGSATIGDSPDSPPAVTGVGLRVGSGSVLMVRRRVRLRRWRHDEPDTRAPSRSVPTGLPRPLGAHRRRCRLRPRHAPRRAGAVGARVLRRDRLPRRLRPDALRRPVDVPARRPVLRGERPRPGERVAHRQAPAPPLAAARRRPGDRPRRAVLRRGARRRGHLRPGRAVLAGRPRRRRHRACCGARPTRRSASAGPTPPGGSTRSARSSATAAGRRTPASPPASA